MLNRIRGTIFVLAASLACSTASSVTAQPRVATAACARAPVLLWPALVEANVRMEEGRIRVAENTHASSSTCIELAFVRIRSTSANPAEPIFMIGGGPGEAVVADVLAGEGYYTHARALSEAADVILVDQPSIGLSRPGLPHPQATPLPLDRPYSGALALEAAIQDARVSVAYWRERGIDLNGYNVANWVDHLDLLRRRLGYGRIAIHGHSFGSHTALAMLRLRPRIVARAMILLPEGLDQTWKLPANVDRIFESYSQRVAQDPVWGERMPDLAGLAREIHARLSVTPVTVALETDAGTREIVLGGEDVLLFLGKQAGDTEFLRNAPAIMARWRDGDFTDLAQYSYRRRINGQLSRSGLWFHLADAASHASEGRATLVRQQRSSAFIGAYLDHVAYEIPQEVWTTPALEAAFRAPIETDIPVQFYVTEFDARTPPSNVTEIAERMTNYGVMTVTNLGHDYPDEGSAVSRAWEQDVVAFLRGGAPITRTYESPTNYAPPEMDQTH